MRAWLFCAWAAVTLTGSVGCAHTLTVQARVIEPAGIPVRAFPNVWIERGQLLAERELSEGLASHLQMTPELSVRLVDADQLAAQRAGGTVPSATVVIVLRLRTEERARVQWTTRPDTVCDALGCYTVSRSYVYDVPMLEGVLDVSVIDGQTSNPLQRAVLRAVEEGRDYDDMLPRLVLTLGERLRQLTEQRVIAVEVTLLEVHLASVEVALELAQSGQWVAARDRMEKVVTSGELATLNAEDQARVLYDLMQVRRFGVAEGESGSVALRSAREALVQARSLDANPLYARALTELDADIRKRQMVDDQRAAAEHNFAIENARPVPPAPVPNEPSTDAPSTDAPIQTP